MTNALIVEDKEENTYYLHALLTGNGFNVTTARHGAEALVKARQSKPDVVISDLLMPVMDGYTLLRHWKLDTHLKNIPFIVYTATYTETEDEKLALSLGADAFILKPSEPEDFMSTLRSVLARSAAGIVPHAKPEPENESELLSLYSETLIRKLEEKTLQLEAANRELKRDISERQQVEQRLRVSLLNEERANAEARTKSAFLAQMSHEIRTPMNGVLGMSELLLNSDLNADQIKYCRIINSSATALLTILNDVLDFSKIEAGRLNIERLPFNLRETIEDLVGLLQLPAAEKKLSLSVHIGEQISNWVVGDSMRLRQILLNYMGNAIKFTERGEVRLTVISTAPDVLRFEVTDTGPGIAPEVQQGLFNLYIQADNSIARVHGGTGLGLAIVKKLAQLMGGNVGAESHLGKGSCFWVELPLPTALQTPPPSTRAPLEHRQLTLLVVEDNEVNRIVIEAMLKKLGHSAVLVDGGQSALDIYQRRHADFDAVLMDCEMPGMSGFEITRHIRGLEKTQNWSRCPVLAVSAHALEEFVQKGRDAGMDGHISKPLTLAQLELSLSAIISTSR